MIPNSCLPKPSELAPLVDAYAQLIYREARADHRLSPVALSSPVHPPGHVPMHWATVRIAGCFSRTADEDCFAAFLLCLQKLYVAPTLTVAQAMSLVRLAERTDDLVCAEANTLPLFIGTTGRVHTRACGYSLRYEPDWWQLRLFTTTAYHRSLSGALTQARTLARPSRHARMTAANA